jgi:hypothetical protein
MALHAAITFGGGEEGRRGEGGGDGGGTDLRVEEFDDSLVLEDIALRLRRREIETGEAGGLLDPGAQLRGGQIGTGGEGGRRGRRGGRDLHEVWDDEGDVEGSVGSVDHALEDELAAAEVVLEGHRGDVFAVLELVELFDAPRHLQEPPLHEHAQVTGVEELHACSRSEGRGGERGREGGGPSIMKKTSLLASSLLR